MGERYKMVKKQFKSIGWLLCVLIIALVIVLLPFLCRNNYLSWIGILKEKDGVTQHASFLEYYQQGNYLNKIGTFDFKIGLGADFFTSFIYYLILDPFNLFLLILPFKSFLLNYSIMIFIKFICTGIFMFLYLKHKKITDKIAIIFSTIYMISGFLVFTLPRHPNLAVGAMYLPLIIYGLELLYDQKKPYLFVISSFICLVSCFYIFYMVSLFVIGYTLLYYFEKYRKEQRNFKHFLKEITKIFLWYFLAILLASFAIVPLIYTYLNAARSESKGIASFSNRYYLDLFSNLFIPLKPINFYTPYKIHIFLILALIPCYFFKGNKTYKIMFIILFIGLLIPLFGFLMNLFNYVNNRWLFLLDFVTCALAAITCNRTDETAILNRPIKQKFMRCINNKKFITFLLVFHIIYILGYNMIYSKEFDNGSVYQSLRTTQEQSLPKNDPHLFYRVDKEQQKEFTDNYVNVPINNQYQGTYSYNTISSKYTYAFLKSLGVYNATHTLGMSGLNQRIVLESLLSVKYYVQQDLANIPFQFDSTDQEGVYENNAYYLPLGIFYKNKISTQDYYQLSLLERQAVLMNHLVVKKDIGSMDDLQTAVTKNVPYQMIQTDGVICENDKIKIEKPSASIQFKFAKEVLSLQELYFNLSQVNSVKKTSSFIVQSNTTYYMQTLFHKGNMMANDIKNYSYLIANNGTEDVELKVSFVNQENMEFAFSFESYHLDYFMQDYQELKEHAMRLKSYNGKKIEGEIDVNESGAVFFSIPYNQGWQAFVDGKKTKLYLANVGFMALDITAGEHHILLKYQTPYLKTGILLSLFALTLFAGYIFYDIYRKNRKNKSLEKEI